MENQLELPISSHRGNERLNQAIEDYKSQQRTVDRRNRRFVDFMKEYRELEYDHKKALKVAPKNFKLRKVLDDLQIQTFADKPYLNKKVFSISKRSTRNAEENLKSIYEDERRQMDLYQTDKTSKQPVYMDNFEKPSYLIRTNFITLKQNKQNTELNSPQFKKMSTRPVRDIIQDMKKSSVSDLFELEQFRIAQEVQQKQEKKILDIVENMNLNSFSKRKVAYSMRSSIEPSFATSVDHQKGGILSQDVSESKLPKIKHRDLAKQIQEMKLKKLQKFTKAYIHDYTIFNYKIDTVLNEAYGFIKTHQK